MTATMRSYAVRYDEIRQRIYDLYGELIGAFPQSPEWVRITRDIDAATKDLRACVVDWQAALRGEAS